MNDDSEDLTHDLFRSFDDDHRIQREQNFTDWCDELAALSQDFESKLKDGIKAHIELQPLRWIVSGLDLIQRSKESLFGTYLPYTLFQMGAEIFLKGMWLCQFEECRLLSDNSYIDESQRQYYLKEIKDKFGHDLLKIVAELRQTERYRDHAATVRFLKIVESVIRTFYFPLYQGDMLDGKWANCRYPKRFYNDVAHKADASAWSKYPEQWLVVELFEHMKRDILNLWDFPPADIGLDGLVREGKRIQSGHGITSANIQAFKLFHQAAVAGHSETQFLVCECYERGLGIKQDRARYLEWLSKSSESGFAAAQNRRGWEAEDHVEKVKWFRLAAEQNNAKGQLNLGDSYRYGYGVAKDPVEAAKWYRKAALQGNARAQDLLASLYKNGEGVARDYEEAARWWRESAEQGEKGAQYELGTCYATGRGVPPDDKEAAMWWTKAAERGSWRACYDLGICYALGKGIPRNKVEAYRWLRIAAQTSADETIGEKAKAEAASLEMLMSSSEIQAGLRLCREFDDQERSRQPRWMTEVFKGMDIDRTWRPLNETIP